MQLAEYVLRINRQLASWVKTIGIESAIVIYPAPNRGFHLDVNLYQVFLVD